ncbi:MAG: pyruvate, phosphate dikinase [Deltaproteobacteria bacterium]|nr:pyruvate, phosphate dikinase [Deltaproteobacteria bacterium]
MKSKKFVYFFGAGKADGTAKMKNLLGGKGANLAEMTNLKIPVPAGFTLSTEVCSEFYKNNKKYPAGLDKQVKENLAKVEKVMGASFGDPQNPLLVSVRSGARASMPGMMDTILNLGLNDAIIEGIIAKSGDKRFAYDTYRRFVQMYSNVVMGMDGSILEHALEKKKKEVGAIHELPLPDTALKADDWKDLVAQFKAEIKKFTGKDFPEDPQAQLWGAVGAVFNSWMNARAIEYRRIYGIPAEWGTAVNVQSMVYGNMGNDCATGVAFTRDPGTGEKIFFGEYLINAQGEDVVAGIRTPQPINIAGKKRSGVDLPSMEETLPPCYLELEKIYKKLERHYRDMQDIEFTIQKNKVWMLQTRSGKRTVQAAVRIAVEMANEKLISKQEAVLRVEPSQLDKLLHPALDPKAKKEVIAKGLPASPGAATGQAVFTAEEAVDEAEKGHKVILVREETSPEDIHGMHVAQGILTARGGMTSHAAVVARGMGKCCVAGCGEIHVEVEKGQFSVGKLTVKRGDWITLNGSAGEVILGKVPTVEPALSGHFGILMKWADGFRKLKVRANADTPFDAKVARSFGAEGIGLCRTEHMFFEADRIDAVREMILASDRTGRDKALRKILPMQKEDFKGIFREMKNLPVTIRLLDPPLHEFLPHTDEEINDLAQKIGVSAETLTLKNASLHEMNPMLGHRGCRLGVTFPEIYDMQVQAVMEAACELVRDEKLKIIPEIMIPIVGHVKELQLTRKNAEAVCQRVIRETGVKIKYLIGTMIELPRASVTADAIATEADFFSFGTNDLTQTTFGISRDDAHKFLPFYVEHKILEKDPFVVLDRDGVGALIKLGATLGRKAKPGLKLGICGEHGGDPESVAFCHQTGLDYVSCSPYRVPVARLAASHAALKK